MKYNCGHEGCDICGARVCGQASISRHEYAGVKYSVCKHCLPLAVKTVVDMAETFGGTIIDPAKPCATKEPSK